MPIPSEYQRASVEFEKFMVDARDISGLATTNMVYNMVMGVFHAFRRRLSLKDALRFADVLPPVVRALFVSDWNPDEPLVDFSDRASMTEEVRAVRKEHNFSPESAIRDVAQALRRNVDQVAFDRLLAQLPSGAREFWQP